MLDLVVKWSNHYALQGYCNTRGRRLIILCSCLYRAYFVPFVIAFDFTTLYTCWSKNAVMTNVPQVYFIDIIAWIKITWPVTYSHVHALKPAVTKSHWTWIFFPSCILAFYTVLLDKNKHIAYFLLSLWLIFLHFCNKTQKFQKWQHRTIYCTYIKFTCMSWCRMEIHTALKIHDCSFVAARDSRPALCGW